jgi:hypothetical protein
MRTVVFDFKADVPEGRQDEVLEQIGGWEHVVKASRINPGAKRPEVRKMSVVYLSDDADPNAVRDALAALPEVEAAATPADRRIV